MSPVIRRSCFLLVMRRSWHAAIRDQLHIFDQRLRKGDAVRTGLELVASETVLLLVISVASLLAGSQTGSETIPRPAPASRERSEHRP